MTEPLPHTLHVPEARAYIAQAQDDLARIRGYCSPSVIADIQEHIWECAARFGELAAYLSPPPAPVASQPRRLPRPLNPLYFVRRRTP